MNDELRAPATEAEWLAYHAIRRQVLFERRGRGSEYDPNHPDEHRRDHHPLVLWHNNAPVAVIRVDIDGDTATFRRVAVREDQQRHGLGRLLLVLAEQFARSRGCSRVESHVDAGAIGFYERSGYSRVINAAPRGDAVLMTKLLGEVS